MSAQAQNPSLASRIRGCLYGIACVDALGAPVEFKRRGSFPPVTKMRYIAHFDLPPGSWTDDTSMTLCLAKSLVEKQGRLDARDQVSRYIKWIRDGYLSSKAGEAFDVGNATRVALALWEETFRNGESDDYGQRQIDEVLFKVHSCGNGSLMRTAPIGLVYFRESEDVLRKNAAQASRITHPHTICIEACQFYVRMIQLILQDAVQADHTALDSFLMGYKFEMPQLKSIVDKSREHGSMAQIPESEILSSGYVVHTLEAALWAFLSTDSFRDGALKVVNLGDDADTVGAVYGGLAGAYYGLEAIPSEWMTALQSRPLLDEVIEGLVELAVHEGR
ncbi:uncharacterized protein KY384_005514 [Bacidia gigantensis]|uniref:uncharacterized protein n=1 Tax=Bacidia gigantensis TaxID=2732470 RepID=UPI001D03BD46|nr:uncharacterized protein KY384_005514 [Bacidia gigantensis]KAG8530032.1 hypothetical protein KY384_005514 [Bacidia gigantensis]